MGIDRMDIDWVLNNLIFEYGIDRYNPGYRDFVRAQALIRQLYCELEKENDEIVIVSEKWADIGYFCDYAGKICRYMVITNPVQPDLEELSQFNGSNCFLVVSLNYRDELTVRLSEKVAKVVDLYDFFEDQGIYFCRNYYEIYPSGYHDFELSQPADDYNELKMGVIFLNHRNRYEVSSDQHLKEKYLGRMIFDCVYNRDFLMLRECVHTYISSGYKDCRSYMQFLEKVESLIAEIKRRMLERDQEDVVMYWLDALEYGEDDEMPFLKSLSETALCMDNMYTVTPSTHPTFRLLFAKKRVIEEQSYNLKVVKRQDSRLIQELEKRGYQFRCYGQWVKNEEEFRSKRYVFKNADFPYVFWTYLKDAMLEPETKLFAVIHELFNTHLPYFSFGFSDRFFSPAHYLPGMPADDYHQKMKKQHSEALRYVDKYLEFYDDILPDKILKMYMSDHGHTYYGRYHVIMKLQQEGILPRRYDDMISLFDFDSYILGILDWKKVDEGLLGKEYVIIQDTEYRHHKYILDSIKNLNISERVLLGYQGVITKKDMLVIHREGITFYPEIYYRKFMNDGKMVTETRIEYLKQLMNDGYVDLNSSDDFKYSRIAVNGMRKHFLRTWDVEEKKWQIISRVIAEIIETGVTAVRGGGMHTERLLMLLDGKVRERIGYVIDRNQECEASHLGMRVILPEEISKYQIKNIVISSFKYRDSWKKEFDGCKELRIVDIYEAMEKEGIMCDREFYLTEYVAEDFL